MDSKIPSKEIRWPENEFPIIVVAENIHSPANIGLLMRICEAFGVQELIFCGSYSNVGTSQFKKTSRSAGRHLKSRFHEDSNELLQEIKNMDYVICALEICKTSIPISDFEFSEKKYAIVIGAERHGILEKSLKMADYHLHINQFGRLGSINVAMALSIGLYEITKQIS